MINPRSSAGMAQFILLIVCLALISTVPAYADWLEWRFNELYSTADHQIQFIELITTDDNQHELGGKQIRSVITANTFVFPSNLPSTNTAGHSVLIATSDFVNAPGAVTPDYIMPADFFQEGDGLLLEEGFSIADAIGYCQPQPAFPGDCIPIDGVQSMNDFLQHGVNSPTNFSGESGSLNAADPNSLYVDFSQQTSGNGSSAWPFNNLTEAVSAANPGGTVNILPGTSAEILTVTKSLLLVNDVPMSGPVIVGQSGARRSTTKIGFVSRQVNSLASK